MSKPSDKQKASKTIQDQAADYDSVFSGVVEMLDVARRASARVVNTLMTATYWEIGRRIVEHEHPASSKPHRRFLMLQDGSVVTCGMSLNHIDKDEVLDYEVAGSENAQHDHKLFEQQWKIAAAI